MTEVITPQQEKNKEALQEAEQSEMQEAIITEQETTNEALQESEQCEMPEAIIPEQETTNEALQESEQCEVPGGEFIRVFATDGSGSEKECFFVLTHSQSDGTCVYDLLQDRNSDLIAPAPDIGPESQFPSVLPEDDNNQYELNLESTQFQLESTPVEHTSKKRLRQESQWKQKKRVKNRNSGNAYVTSRGKEMPGKNFNAEHVCGCKRSYECSNFTVVQRQIIFDSFWNIGNLDLQNANLSALVDERPVARRTVKSIDAGEVATGSVEAKKKLSRSYHFLTDTGRKQVCKDLFLTTFGISNGRLDRVLQSRRTNNGIVKPDQRGKHVKHKY